MNDQFGGDKIPNNKLLRRLKIKIRATKEIHNLGISANIKGYEYVREAIVLVVEDRRNIVGVTKILYPKVAKTFDSIATRVERAIRHAVEVGCDRCHPDKLNDMFKNTIRWDKGKPTNSEFIAMVADKIRLDMELDDAN